MTKTPEPPVQVPKKGPEVQNGGVQAKAVRVTRVMRPIDTWVAVAALAHANGETVTWDAYLTALPDPAQNNMITALAIYLAIPGAVVGTNVATTAVLQPSSVTEAIVDTTVAQLMQTLIDGRSQQIASMEQAATEAARTGRPNPAGGLIVP